MVDIIIDVINYSRMVFILYIGLDKYRIILSKWATAYEKAFGLINQKLL